MRPPSGQCGYVSADMPQTPDAGQRGTVIRGRGRTIAVSATAADSFATASGWARPRARPDLRLMWLLDALRGMGRRARIGYSDGGELTARERELVLTAHETRTVSALITQPPAPDQRFGRTAAVAA